LLAASIFNAYLCIGILPVQGEIFPSLDEASQISLTAVSEKQAFQGRYALFQGDVSLEYNGLLRVLSPKLFVDTQRQRIWSDDNQLPTVFETDDLLVFTDSPDISIISQTGRASNVRFHTRYGYLRAQEIARVSDELWELNDLEFSGCSNTLPHWSFSSKRAVLDGHRVRTSGVQFNLQAFPVLTLPIAGIPFYKPSQSGFLIPRLSFDREQGLGIQQEYFLSFSPETDMTFGINYRAARGAVLSYEVRSHKEDISDVIAMAYVGFNRHGKLDQHTGALTHMADYWLTARGFLSQWKDQGFSTQFVLDYGTDHQMNDLFFIGPSDQDDLFGNVASVRYATDDMAIDISGRLEIQRRMTFVPSYVDAVTSTGDEHTQQRLTISCPHAQWHLFPRSLIPGYVWYSHVSSADVSFVDSFNRQIVYDPENPARIKTPLFNQTVRVNYEGSLVGVVHNKLGTLESQLSPIFQLRSNYDRRVSEHSQYSFLFLKTNITARTPEFSSLILDNALTTHTGYFRWEWLPLLTKRHSIFIDHNEQVYARSIFSIGSEHTIVNPFGTITAEISQPFSLQPTADVFATPLFTQYVLPLQIELICAFSEQLALYTHTEFDITHPALTSTRSGLSLQNDNFAASLGIIYEHPKAAQIRSLLTQGGTFLHGDVSLPITRSVQLNYEGEWNFDMKNDEYALLSHNIDVAYRGHCWSVKCGYQEKGYMHYGRYKQEQSLYILFSFDALGSLQTRVKKWWQRR